jgi:putative methionine-R-sulfoxide reductase with GAF domain
LTGCKPAFRLHLVLQIPVQEIAVKTYRTPQELEARIETALARKAGPHNTPLDEVAEILGDGRHYSWIGIYLVAGEVSKPGPSRAKTASRPTQTHAVIPVALGQHVYGAVEVQSEKAKVLSAQYRILLKRVAERLAKYLHGPGAWLVRKAREAAAETQPAPQERGHQPASEKAPERTLAAAGEGRR